MFVMSGGISAMCSVDDECDDWGRSLCQSASGRGVQSVELSAQRQQLMRLKEFDRFQHEIHLSSGSLLLVYILKQLPLCWLLLAMRYCIRVPMPP